MLWANLSSPRCLIAHPCYNFVWFCFLIIAESLYYSIHLRNLVHLILISINFFMLDSLGNTRYQFSLFILHSLNLNHLCITDEASLRLDTYLHQFHKQPWNLRVLNLCIYNIMENDSANLADTYLSWTYPNKSR